MHKFNSGAGFVLVLLGAGGMDSHNIIIPGALLIFGLAQLYFIKENRPS